MPPISQQGFHPPAVFVDFCGRMMGQLRASVWLRMKVVISTSEAELRQKTRIDSESKPCSSNCMVEMKGEFDIPNLSRTFAISPD